MSSGSINQFNQTFFAFGLMTEPLDPLLGEKIRDLGDKCYTFPLEGIGFFFYTSPEYVDLAQTEEMVWIRLGFVHDGQHLVSMQEILNLGWAGRQGVNAEKISGSATLIGFQKHKPNCFIYCNLISPPLIYYWRKDGNLLVTDNLHLMKNLLPEPQLNTDVVAQHYIYRYVYGEESYLKGVKKLLPGELLSMQAENFRVDLVRDLRQITNPADQIPVTEESIAWFYDQFKHEISIHLQDRLERSGTTLSGGIDSSLLQSAIFDSQPTDFQFPTYSFVIESSHFDYEIEYAKQASKRFKTKHHFVPVSQQQFAEYIIESIDVLGRPISFDGTAYFWGLLKHLSANEKNIKYLFDGTLADGLLGSPRSIWIIQGDKYRNWPIPILDLLGLILKPFSQSKSYGAQSAARTLRDQNNLDSPDCYLNNGDMGTNWNIVRNSFPPQVLSDALAVNRNIEKRYLGSDFFVEQLNVIGLLTGSIEHTVLLRQLGLYEGIEFIFPYSDEAIVEAAFSFRPLERYTYRNYPKPVLRFALQSRAPLDVINQHKGQSSLMTENVFPWMREGSLRDLVKSIDRPQYISSSNFDKIINQPDWLTWNLLTMDLFLKNVLKNN